jgi:hypothetical protein
MILLTLLVVSAAILAIYHLNQALLVAYGSILAAAGSFVAVIWFTGSLWYQAQQLKEQREQFQKEFAKAHEEGRRNALLLARDILNNAEARALGLNPDMSSLSDLFPLYANFSEFKEIMESDDPATVQEAVKNWAKKEGPAMAIMKGIKSAAQVYFVAVGQEGIDYSKEADEFVYIYGSHLWNLPFFDAFHSIASILTEFMLRLEPGRKVVPLASFGALAAQGYEKLLKMDSIRKDIEAYREKGYPIPKIAERL